MRQNRTSVVPLYGRAHVCANDQDLRLQRAALKAADCNVIRAEKASGSRRDGRTEMQMLLDFVRQGDTLLVAREGKASNSFIQQHLNIGYNKAAKLIEQMEKEGIISPANHVGKREILVRRMHDDIDC